MSTARTLWEEGRMAPARVVRLAVIALVLVVALDVVVTDGLSPLFDVGFTLICIGAALSIRPGQFFWIGVLPPLLLLAVVVVLAVVDPTAIGEAQDGRVQSLFSGLAHHSGALFAGYANALVVLGVRGRATRLRQESTLRRSSPYAINDRPRTSAAPAVEPDRMARA